MTGQQIKELRNEKGLSQEELARLLNTTKQNISSYERELTSIPQDIIRRLSALFGIDIRISNDDTEIVPILTKEEFEVLVQLMLFPDYTLTEEEVNLVNKLEILYKTKVNCFTLKEISQLRENFESSCLSSCGYLNKIKLTTDLDDFYCTLNDKIDSWEEAILSTMCGTIREGYNNQDSLNISIYNENKFIYKKHLGSDYQIMYHNLSKEELDNIEYYVDLSKLSLKSQGYYNLTFESEMKHGQKKMFLYSIVCTDDQSKGYITVAQKKKTLEDYISHNYLSYATNGTSHESMINVMSILFSHCLHYEDLCDIYVEPFYNLTKEECLDEIENPTEKVNLDDYYRYLRDTKLGLCAHTYDDKIYPISEDVANSAGEVFSLGYHKDRPSNIHDLYIDDIFYKYKDGSIYYPLWFNLNNGKDNEYEFCTTVKTLEELLKALYTSVSKNIKIEIPAIGNAIKLYVDNELFNTNTDILYDNDYINVISQIKEIASLIGIEVVELSEE